MEQNIEQPKSETISEVKLSRSLKDKISSLISWVAYLVCALLVLALTVPSGPAFLFIVFMVLASAPFVLRYMNERSQRLEVSRGLSWPRRILNLVTVFFVVFIIFVIIEATLMNISRQTNGYGSTPVAPPSLNNL